jgi:hypothetical protein
MQHERAGARSRAAVAAFGGWHGDELARKTLVNSSALLAPPQNLP